ncbi:unnamed protein product [Adineta steineri]|uniref:Uncharacterized protein n=1 Tax=Adineta steineri TaxID=433720 RepID=A0A815SUH2_9BILA|nr:unnamed protein product [Adineta steineri]CAF3566417.1 unnamed protein product [Adineta steineri]CAF4204569.1 unnamed protein product [Adineta steineri]
MATSRQNTYVQIPHPDGGTPNTGDLVELVFDKLSPRPHFIVRQTEGNVDKNAKANEISETMVLVTNFLRKRSNYDKQVILSFHRGCWYQEHETPWHCHLCVPMEEYCYEAKKELGDDYISKLRTGFQKTSRKYEGYKMKTVASAKNLQSMPFNVKSYDKNGFGLVWMIPDPRIGVYSQKPQELHLLYDFMVDVYEQMEKDLSSKHESFKKFGSHCCIFVSGESQLNTTPRTFKVLNEIGTNMKTEEIVGYIQMGEQEYYRLLPDESHRQVWLNMFKEHDFIVIT